jgi:hypothetical protein
LRTGKHLLDTHADILEPNRFEPIRFGGAQIKQLSASSDQFDDFRLFLRGIDIVRGRTR